MEDYLRELKKTKKENTVLSYEHDLFALSRYFEGRELKVLTEEDLQEYFSRLSRRISFSTLSRCVSAVKGYYRFLGEKDPAFADPMTHISPADFSPKREPSVSGEEFQMLLNLSVPGIRGRRDEAMIALLCETGIRVSELVEMDREDLLPEVPAVLCGKGEKRRQISISREAMNLLEQCRSLAELAAPSEDALFLGSTGKRITRQGFWKNLKERALHLGICDCTPQVLRRSFAMKLISQGEERVEVKKLLGNRSDALLRMYEKQVKEKENGIV